MLKGLSE